MPEYSCMNPQREESRDAGRPSEPLDYIGPDAPPSGYVRMGWACPRDATLRCPGCDEHDLTPVNCGFGHPAYRSRKWIAWVEAGRATEGNTDV